MTDCTAPPLNMTVSGDNLYGPRSSDQNFIDWVSRNYPISSGSFGNGFGWDTPTDFRRPFGRTLNAIWCLEYSSPTPSEDGYDGPILDWAGHFARQNFDGLEGHCGDDWDGNCNSTGVLANTDLI